MGWVYRTKMVISQVEVDSDIHRLSGRTMFRRILGELVWMRLKDHGYIIVNEMESVS